jgi:hypothetical protein
MENWSWVAIAKAVIVLAAIIAIVLVAVRAMGLRIPEWAIHCLWIVAIVFVALVCLHIIASL